jgi:hypothetical protein
MMVIKYHPTMLALLTLEETAAELGITVNAVRQRIKFGTLTRVSTDKGWLIDMSATDQSSHGGVSSTTTTDRPTNHATPVTNQQPTIDLAPLADVIRDQNRRIEELSAAAAFWQIRATQAEEQLKQPTAGDGGATESDTQEEPSQDTPSAFTALGHSGDREPQGIWGWLRRLVGG